MITVFLDTNVILDYLESRDDVVRHLVEMMIRGRYIRVATSFFNLIEVIDKEKDIITIGKLLLKRFSFDEISKMRGDRSINDDEKGTIADKINKFVKDIDEEIYTLDEKGYNKAMELIQEMDLQSQDALIVATYLTIEEGANFFLSNDSNLIKVLKGNNIFDCFNLKEDEDIKELEKIFYS